MKLIKVSQLFNIKYGVNLELNVLKKCESGIGIPFISRTSNNNGVSAYVLPINNIKPNPPNTISVSGGGSVLESFLQKEPYYSGRDLFYLTPKQPLTDLEMLYYCSCLRANKYKYNYGRQANKTLKDILIPDRTEIPQWVYTAAITLPLNTPLRSKPTPVLGTLTWKEFRYDKIFDIKKGFYNKKPEETEKSYEDVIPFIGATEYNNGITSSHTIEQIEVASKDGSDKNQQLKEKIFQGNCITVSNNGSVGNAFYQNKEFTCSHDVNPLYLKDRVLTKYIAIFLCSIIELEKYRWNYGRKWRPMRMPDSIIKLPIDSQGNPDWQFMEDYIKTLPYSGTI